MVERSQEKDARAQETIEQLQRENVALRAAAADAAAVDAAADAEGCEPTPLALTLSTPGRDRSYRSYTRV